MYSTYLPQCLVTSQGSRNDGYYYDDFLSGFEADRKHFSVTFSWMLVFMDAKSRDQVSSEVL